MEEDLREMGIRIWRKRPQEKSEWATIGGHLWIYMGCEAINDADEYNIKCVSIICMACLLNIILFASACDYVNHFRYVGGKHTTC